MASKLRIDLTGTKAGRRSATFPSWRRYKAPASMIMLAILVVLALPTVSYSLTTLSQGFLTKDKVSLGSIVSLTKNTTDQVNAATQENVDNILGVVISDNNSLLSLRSGEQTQIQVATNGIAQILVADINGEIKQGDAITASPIAGVGMKATENTKIIGIAQGNMTDSRTSKQTYKTKDGQEEQVTLGEVPALISVAHFFKEAEKTIIPSAVQNVANALAGKNVRPVPIIISLLIFVVAMITVVSIVFSMIRSSIISVGRNPMAQGAVYRNVIQLSGLVMGILALAVVAIYMILTRL